MKIAKLKIENFGSIVILSLFFFASSAFAWTEPSQSPPNGNVVAPLRTASSPLSVSGSNLTLGTIGVGIGGTGRTSLTANNLLYGNGSGIVNLLAPATGYLYWNGSAFAWQTPPSSLPSQSGQSGKFLTTNGSTASWATVTQGGGTLTGSGTSGHVPRWTGASSLGNSAIESDGDSAEVADDAFNAASLCIDWVCWTSWPAGLADGDNDSGGDITGVTAGTGLTGGGTTGTPTISLSTPVAPANLGSGTANSSTFLRGDGTWATPANSGGDITGVTAGTGLSGGGASGAVTLSLSTPVAAASLGTGTANSSTFLRGDGTWAAPPAAGAPAWSSITSRPSGLDDGDDIGVASESDPTVASSVKDGVSWSELTGATWKVGNPNWGSGALEVHNNSWDSSSNGDYGAIAGGKIYAYSGLQSGGNSGSEAGAGQLYVSGDSTLMGNVGIGTASPSGKLHILQTNQDYGIYAHLSQSNYGVAAIYAISGRAGSPAIYGYNSSTGDALRGYNSSTGYGVYCFTISGLCGGNKAWTNNSDARLKKNIETITDGLDKVMELRGVTYEWKEGDGKKNIGFIAQEVMKVLPEVVNKDNEGYYTLNESSVTAVLVEAVKELKAENDELKQRIEALERRIR